MKKLVSLLLVALTFNVLQAKEIKIGVVMPMTGPIGGFGQSAVEGLTVMNEMSNKLDNGDTIKLILLDNKSDKIETATAVTKLISSDKVSAVLGALTSGNTLAMTKIAEDAKVPVVAPVATNILVTKRKEYISRVCFSDAFQGEVAANFAINNLKIKEAVVITDVKSDYSIGIAKVFKRKYKKFGGKITKNLKISMGDKDFKAILSSIKALNPKLVFIPFYSAEAALVAKQARQLGITAKFLGTDGMTADKVFFDVGGKSVEGFYATDLYSPSAPKTTQLSKDFEKAYKAKYNKEVHPFGVLLADSYNVVLNAMNQCEDAQDSVCVNKNIRKTKDYQGASGVITLDKGNAVRSAVINQIKDGKTEFLTSVNP